MSFPMKTGLGGTRYPVISLSTEPLELSPIMQVYNLLYHHQIYCKIDRENRNILHGKINSKPFQIEADENYEHLTTGEMHRTEFFRFSSPNNGREMHLPIEETLNEQAIKEIFLELFPTLVVVEWLIEYLNVQFPNRFVNINGMIFGVYNGQRVQIYESVDDMGLGIECFKILNRNTSQKIIAFDFENPRDTNEILYHKLITALDKITASGFRTRVVDLYWPPWLDQSKKPPPDFFWDRDFNWADYPE